MNKILEERIAQSMEEKRPIRLYVGSHDEVVGVVTKIDASYIEVGPDPANNPTHRHRKVKVTVVDTERISAVTLMLTKQEFKDEERARRKRIQEKRKKQAEKTIERIEAGDDDLDDDDFDDDEDF